MWRSVVLSASVLLGAGVSSANEPGPPLADFYDAAWVATDGTRLSGAEAIADRLAGYDVIVFGELHGHVGVHRQQMALMRALETRRPGLILSLEQFETDVQPVVDSYLAGRIGEAALIRDGRAWSHYAQSYRPMVEYARANGLTVVAAEAPTWAVSCIGQMGPEVLERFTPEERGWVAASVQIPSDGAYYDKYMSFVSGGSHGGGGEEAEARARRSFAAQIARDDTMAERIVAAVAAHPGRQVLHLTGTFHAEGRLGTVERILMRRPDLKVAVIVPYEINPANPVLDAEALAGGEYTLAVLPVPPMFVDGEPMTGMMGPIKRTPCKYAEPAVE